MNQVTHNFYRKVDRWQTGKYLMTCHPDSSGIRQGSVDYLNLILSRAGHKIVHTYTGFEALERCRQRPRFDVILMDIKLPGIDGYETTRRIRDLGISTPIIALSAFAYPEDRDRALEAGCNDYLIKPISKEVLFERITKYCR